MQKVFRGFRVWGLDFRFRALSEHLFNLRRTTPTPEQEIEGARLKE